MINTSKIARLSFVEHVRDYTLRLAFDDGYSFELNVLPYLRGEMGLPLRDPKKFQEFYIEPLGGLAWPNGFDFCPDYLREYAENEVHELQS